MEEGKEKKKKRWGRESQGLSYSCSMLLTSIIHFLIKDLLNWKLDVEKK